MRVRAASRNASLLALAVILLASSFGVAEVEKLGTVRASVNVADRPYSYATGTMGNDPQILSRLATVRSGGIQTVEAETPASTPAQLPTSSPTPTPTQTPITTTGPTALNQSPTPPVIPMNPTFITSDTVWTKTGSPYNFTGPVNVEYGATLTIEPGVVVDLGRYYLQVNGALIARGTPSESINFNGKSESIPLVYFLPSEDSVYRGGEIDFSPSSTSWNEQTRSGCIVEYANLKRVEIRGSSPKISHSFTWGISVFDGGSPEISDNTITAGISLYGSSGTITGNTITQQAHYFIGVIAQDDNRNFNVIVVGSESSAVISNNIIDGSVGSAYTGIGGTDSLTPETYDITNNTIYGCREAGIAIGNSQATIVVSDNKIYDCGTAIKTTGTTIYLIQRNLITNNTEGINVASQATVQNNTIASNSIGISASSPPAIVFNNLQNKNCNIQMSTSINLNATYNWWGTNDIQAINQTFYDFKNDNNLGAVNFIPFLVEPNPQASPIPSPTPSPSPSANPTISPSDSTTQQPTSEPIKSAQPTTVPIADGVNTLPYILGSITVIVTISIGAGLVMYLRQKQKQKEAS